MPVSGDDAPTLDCLRNPVEGNYDISDKKDTVTRLSLDHFLAADNALDAVAVYNYVCDAIPSQLEVFHCRELHLTP